MTGFIDIPKVDGVPSLTSYALGAISLMSQDLISGYGDSQLTPKWGLYSKGRPVIVADTVCAVGFRAEWAISKYPIEDGGFESYDRVTQPFECHLQFASGTNNANRQTLLLSLDAATADGNLTKYDVVTPEIIYAGVNIDHVSYDRKAAAGLGVLLVDVTVQEIREQNTGQQNAQSPSGNASQEDGSVQPQTTSSGGIGSDIVNSLKQTSPGQLGGIT